MSDYTITLKRCCDVYGKDNVLFWFKNYQIRDFLPEEQANVVISSSFLNKNVIAKAIVDHYYFREIAFETPEMFSHYAQATMNEIMAYYLPLIYTLNIKYEPFNDETVNITETFIRNRNGDNVKKDLGTSTSNSTGENKITTDSSGKSSTSGASASTSKNTSSSLNVASDTPQGQISKEAILQGNWATSTSANENSSKIEDSTSTSSVNSLTNAETKKENSQDNTSLSSSNTSNGNFNENEEYEKTRKGYEFKKSKSELMAEYRKNITNVLSQIINELDSLFFALY